MSIKRLFIGCILIVFSNGLVNAQASLLNAKEVDQIGKKTKEQIAADNDGPLPYGFIDDRDIVWSKVVWEIIDFNQKINFPYYYPIEDSSVETNRLSLYNTLSKALKEKKFKFYSDSFFTSEQTLDDIKDNLSVTCQDGYDYPLKAQDVMAFMIKGMYYFDKRQGEMKYRIIAIAPMIPDLSAKFCLGEKSNELYELYWVFYPEVRRVLYDSKVFNPDNSSQPISYDHLLNARRFASTIVREENMYGNRAVRDYIRGNSLFQLLEVNRIKEGIRNREMDMWNY